MKITRPFAFTYTVKNQVVENLQLVTKEVIKLQIHGTGCHYPGDHFYAKDFDADIDFIYYADTATDILELVQITELYDDIKQQAQKVAEGLDYRTTDQKYKYIADFIFSLVKNEYHYFNTSLIVQQPLENATFTAHAICVSPSNDIYLGQYSGTGDFLEWHQIDTQDFFIIDLVCKHIEQEKTKTKIS